MSQINQTAYKGFYNNILGEEKLSMYRFVSSRKSVDLKKAYLGKLNISLKQKTVAFATVLCIRIC